MHPKAGHPPRWPKGPFPEKYKFEAVESRLVGAWDSDDARTALALVTADRAPFPGYDDPYVRLLVSASRVVSLDEVRTALAGRAVTAFRFVTSTRDDVVTNAHGEILGLVATADPIDAVVAVGAAGPRHGIGTAAIVRFLAALKTFARWQPSAIGEEHLALSLVPRDADCAERIGERILKICPPLVRRGVSAASLANEMRADGTLTLDWS